MPYIPLSLATYDAEIGSDVVHLPFPEGPDIVDCGCGSTCDCTSCGCSGSPTSQGSTSAETPRTPGLPPAAGAPEASRTAAEVHDAYDVSDLDALALQYEYRRVRLSFERLGMPSADTQVFHLRNVMGSRVEVRDSAGQLVLDGAGFIQPIGYSIQFLDPLTGQPAFGVRTLDLQKRETYELISPDFGVVATATRKRFRHRTDIQVCAGKARSGNPVEMECKSLVQHALQAGRYQVSTPDGLPLGTVRRHFRRGVVTHQTFTVVVAPDVDPYLMVFVALVCNCINNERPKLAWSLAAAGMIAAII